MIYYFFIFYGFERGIADTEPYQIWSRRNNLLQLFILRGFIDFYEKVPGKHAFYQFSPTNPPPSKITTKKKKINKPTNQPNKQTNKAASNSKYSKLTIK